MENIAKAFPRLKGMFDQALLKGLEYPCVRVKIGHLPLKLYLAKKGYIAIVNNQTKDYYGKLTENGAYFSRDTSNADSLDCMAVLRWIANGGDFGVLGKELGSCCFCGRELTNDGSLEHGYGPICADKYGLPWHGYSSKGEQKIEPSASITDQIIKATEDRIALLEKDLAEAKALLTRQLNERKNDDQL